MMRRCAVKNLAHRAKPGIAQVIANGFQPSLRYPRVAMHSVFRQRIVP